MKSAIPVVLLVVGMLSIGESVRRHYFAEVEEVWSESEVEEINQLSFSMHAATVPGAEVEGSKEVRESRLHELYAKQDKSVNSGKRMTTGLWWGGFLFCLAGIGLTLADKRKITAALGGGPAEGAADGRSEPPPIPSESLGPEALGEEHWR